MDEIDRVKLLASYPPDTDWFLEFVEARQDAEKLNEQYHKLKQINETFITDLGQARADVVRLREDNNEYAQINGIMQKLLVSVANALKGEPQPLHTHDWSDLPAVAQAMRNELLAAEGTIRTWEALWEEHGLLHPNEEGAEERVVESPLSNPMVTVPYDAVETIVSWWRSGTEAPGGCSYGEAIVGMRDAVWQLELARRDQFERPCPTCGRVITVTRPCPFCKEQRPL